MQPPLQHADRALIVTANDFDSIYAMNRIIAAVQAKSNNYKVRLAGCVANRSRETDEVDRYCNTVGFNRIAHMPDLDAIRRSRLKKKTLFEMPDDEEVVQVRKEYVRLAETLWNGTEPLAPAPLPDREIFELLGFGLMRDEVFLSGLPDASAAEPRPGYAATRARVETYFDKTATRTWERLTSDAPVSRIRQTVRAGRDRMRALMLSRLPADLRGARVLDAGCGAGQVTIELAKRGAEVLATDISPSLVGIAERRLPDAHRAQVTFTSGDMLSPELGRFDHAIAMDSLIYYDASDIGRALAGLEERTGGKILFTVAPPDPAADGDVVRGQAFSPLGPQPRHDPA